MNDGMLWVPVVVAALHAGLLLLLPRIGRRGLLFGVYVGEENSDGATARRITRSWYLGMAIWLGLLLAAGVAGVVSGSAGFAVGAPPSLLIAGFFAEYARAYRRARALARRGGAPIAVAVIASGEPGRAARPRAVLPLFADLLPVAALIFGVGCGLATIGYAWSRYEFLPASIPVHFGPSGRADAWASRSLALVLLLPAMTLLMGVGLGGAALLVGRAKRALRAGDGGVSFAAQQRFRAAVARFLAGAAILATTLLTVLSIGSVRAGLGLSAGLSPWVVWPVAGGLILFTLGGTPYLALRYGQGGSRLERSAAGAPLTDGLADNRHWIAGIVYVNRDDPALFVEHRFGLGYTLNLGNWKAVTLLAGFLAATTGLVIASIVLTR